MSKETVDTRKIVRGISFLPPHDKATGLRPAMVVVTDVAELQELANQGKVNLKQLFEAGAIEGNWDSPEAA